MCGRFARTSSAETFAHLFDAVSTIDLHPSYNIAPTQSILAARRTKKGGRELVSLHWGLVPHWSKGADSKYTLINARSDSVDTKPAYREPFKRRRCLIATDGFFEWKTLDKVKQPYFIRMRDGQPFAFAGIWDRWEPEGVEPIESCSIITCAANRLVKDVHDRMPVIVAPHSYSMWLDTDAERSNGLVTMLLPYDASQMEAYPVGRGVNSPKNNSPELIEPVH